MEVIKANYGLINIIAQYLGYVDRIKMCKLVRVEEPEEPVTLSGDQMVKIEEALNNKLPYSPWGHIDPKIMEAFIDGNIRIISDSPFPLLRLPFPNRTRDIIVRCKYCKEYKDLTLAKLESGKYIGGINLRGEISLKVYCFKRSIWDGAVHLALCECKIPSNCIRGEDMTALIMEVSDLWEQTYGVPRRGRKIR